MRDLGSSISVKRLVDSSVIDREPARLYRHHGTNNCILIVPHILHQIIHDPQLLLPTPVDCFSKDQTLGLVSIAEI